MSSRRAALHTFSVTTPVAPTAPTFAEWLASTNSDAGPANYWPTIATASVGGVNFTHVNSVETGITDAESVPWIGLDGASSNPMHATATTPMQSGAFTALMRLQVDAHASKYIPLTMGLGLIAGSFSVELVDDGASGLKPRVFSATSVPGYVIYVGTAAGTIPIGEPFWLFYKRTASGGQEVWTVDRLGNVTQIALTLSSGTPPVSWPNHPAGTWYAGAWSTGASAFNGVMGDLALWNVALSTADIVGLGTISPQVQRVVWAKALDAGAVETAQVKDTVPTPYIHPEVNYTVTVTDGTGTRGTLAAVDNLLRYTAGSTPGAEAGVSWKITKDSIDSPTVAHTITVAAPPQPLDLPYFGQYYGAGAFGYAAANTNLTTTTSPGVSVFFRAERNGTIDRIRFQQRFGEGYSTVGAVTYEFTIWPADPTTKRPITSGGYHSRRASWTTTITQDMQDPGGSIENFYAVGLTDNPTPVVAGNPYCLAVRKVSGSGSFAWNTALVYGHNQGIPEPGISGTHPLDVGSSVVAVSGWCPVWLNTGAADEIEWYPYPTISTNSAFRYHGESLVGVRYSDGIWAGLNWQASETSFRQYFSGSNHVRYRFTVSRATRTVDGVFVRVCRRNATTGTLSVRLENGAASPSNENGTEIETVLVDATHLTDVGANENWVQASGATTVTKVAWIWMPFTTPRSLTIGFTYSLRVFATSGLQCSIWPRYNTTAKTWTVVAGQDTAQASDGNPDWTCWEDADPGTQISANAGSSWTTLSYKNLPVVFRCV